MTTIGQLTQDLAAAQRRITELEELIDKKGNLDRDFILNESNLRGLQMELYRQSFDSCEYTDPSNNMPYPSYYFNTDKFFELVWKAATQAEALKAGDVQSSKEGLKLVPIEPTPKMLVAMWEHRETMRGESENKIALVSYKAMLSAASTDTEGK